MQSHGGNTSACDCIARFLPRGDFHVKIVLTTHARGHYITFLSVAARKWPSPLPNLVNPPPPRAHVTFSQRSSKAGDACFAGRSSCECAVLVTPVWCILSDKKTQHSFPSPPSILLLPPLPGPLRARASSPNICPKAGRRKGGRKGGGMTADNGQWMLATNNGRLTKDDRRWTMDDGQWTTTMTNTTIKQSMGDG